MRLHHEKLRRKGWSDAEITRVTDAVKRADEKKRPLLGFLEKAVFWILLAITIFGIFAVSLEIVPALLLLNESTNILILVLLGLSLGSLFSLIIKDIEWLEQHHHLFTFLVLGVIAVANIWLIVIVTRTIEKTLAISNPHDGFMLGLVFAASLLTPYLLHLLREAARDYSLHHSLRRKQ